jgi:Na+-driven multidrug efflux pump
LGIPVARFAGATQPEKVNRVVYQAFLTAFALSAVMAVVGHLAAPTLLDSVNAAPEVKAEALPFLRAMFVGIFGLMMFFMLSGAFRAAGDPRTPLRLGVAMTVLSIAFNVVLIPMFGTVGAAYATVASSALASSYGIWRLLRPESVIHFDQQMDRAPDFSIIRSLFLRLRRSTMSWKWRSAARAFASPSARTAPPFPGTAPAAKFSRRSPV